MSVYPTAAQQLNARSRELAWERRERKRRKKPRTWVKTFMPIMARQVEARTKRQTVRPWPKRERDIPKAGHRISCREWTGKPYSSKQRVLCEGRITEVLHIRIRRGGGITLHRISRRKTGIHLPLCEHMMTAGIQRMFASKDGFDSLAEFRAWFLKDGAAEFRGVLIKWEPDAERKCVAAH